MPRRSATIASQAGTGRGCDNPGCDAGGQYQAPKSRLRPNEYYWFCLDCVRAYNKSWNYHAGMGAAELEREARRAAVWDRPTWTFGTRRAAAAGAYRLDDPLGVLGEETAESRRKAPDPATARALDIMGLSLPVSRTKLRDRYKTLVKRNHPDRHGGSRKAEERLKLINEAYTTLKEFII